MHELRRQSDPVARTFGENGENGEVGVRRRSSHQTDKPGPSVLAHRVLLAITGLGSEEAGYLEKLAALATASGAQLRLAYCADRGRPHERPLARLRQRARHLGRLLDQPVETVDFEIQTPDALRHQLQDCALGCIARPASAGPWASRRRDVLNTLVGLRTRPVLVLGDGRPGRYTSALVPVGLGAGSPQLLRWADAMAPDAAIELLHVTEIPQVLLSSRPSQPASVLEQALRRSRAALEHRLRGLAEGWQRPQTLRRILLTGDLAAQIGQRQAGAGHDLVVLGIRARSGWPDLLRPPLALRLARRLGGDLLVVPQDPARDAVTGNWPEGLWT